MFESGSSVCVCVSSVIWLCCLLRLQLFTSETSVWPLTSLQQHTGAAQVLNSIYSIYLEYTQYIQYIPTVHTVYTDVIVVIVIVDVIYCWCVCSDHCCLRRVMYCQWRQISLRDKSNQYTYSTHSIYCLYLQYTQYVQYLQCVLYMLYLLCIYFQINVYLMIIV